ncbi:hypothetical protein AK830_g3954 [Neonectria ditissima]|uniref:Secreted protein n=1 Tax=Neonectria ditissima TaxID=78410 RepID=A0A0P7B7Q4_9HYPO|nr:hypothetical protein AK830_g3954 [Neonectria ditissima]
MFAMMAWFCTQLLHRICSGWPAGHRIHAWSFGDPFAQSYISWWMEGDRAKKAGGEELEAAHVPARKPRFWRRSNPSSRLNRRASSLYFLGDDKVTDGRLEPKASPETGPVTGEARNAAVRCHRNCVSQVPLTHCHALVAPGPIPKT